MNQDAVLDELVEKRYDASSQEVMEFLCVGESHLPKLPLSRMNVAKNLEGRPTYRYNWDEVRAFKRSRIIPAGHTAGDAVATE